MSKIKTIKLVKLYSIIVFSIFFIWAGQTPPANAAPANSQVAAHGTFQGASDHVTTGGISVLKTPAGYVVVLESDFSLDNAPSPTIGFGKDGQFDKKTDWAKLTSKKGLQVYAVPASVDPEKYNEFYIWCRKFSVPLGVAKIN
ncbi:MAG: DM13 domain-containing protein [Hyphomicrobiaceae bacterium]